MTFRIGMLEFHYRTPRDEQAAPSNWPACSTTRRTRRLRSEVWNAVALAGVDDHILFLEHPDLPEHWRSKSGAPQ